MIKKVIIVLVFLGFAWSLPLARAKMVGAMQPGLALLGPVGVKLKQPMLKHQADADLKFLLEQLQIDRTEGRAQPGNTRAFNEWMYARQGAGERGRDPWGNLYWMKRGEGAVTVGSNGPDGTHNTRDDIRRSTAF